MLERIRYVYKGDVYIRVGGGISVQRGSVSIQKGKVSVYKIGIIRRIYDNVKRRF
jgi:hypothetical protein